MLTSILVALSFLYGAVARAGVGAGALSRGVVYPFAALLLLSTGVAAQLIHLEGESSRIFFQGLLGIWSIPSSIVLISLAATINLWRGDTEWDDRWGMAARLSWILIIGVTWAVAVIRPTDSLFLLWFLWPAAMAAIGYFYWDLLHLHGPNRKGTPRIAELLAGFVNFGGAAVVLVSL